MEATHRLTVDTFKSRGGVSEYTLADLKFDYIFHDDYCQPTSEFSGEGFQKSASEPIEEEHVLLLPDRGKSLPRLHKACVESNQGWRSMILKARFLVETHAVNPYKVGPMKPLQGPTTVGQQKQGWAMVLRISYCWLPQDVVLNFE